MRVQIWSLYRGCLAFGLLSCHDAIAASAKSVAASIDLKAEIGRSLTIGQPQAAPKATGPAATGRAPPNSRPIAGLKKMAAVSS